MMNRRAVLLGVLSAGVGCFAAEQPDFTIRSEVRLVLLDVAVTNRRGAFVSGLPRETFHVTENGRPQNITVFAQEDLPVTVGILVDESQSMFPKRLEVINAAESFIQESNPKDEIFVLNFNDQVERGLRGPALFSSNIRELRAALFRGVPRGKTALNDAIADGLKQLHAGRRDKKTLVVISDGGDNASHYTRRQLLDMVESNIATIYAIGLYTPEDPERDPGILRTLARISGGVAYFPRQPSEMTAVCRSIAQDIRSRYTLGYIPSGQATEGPLRRIHVQVSAPGERGLSVRTRSSYHYDAVNGHESESSGSR